MKIINKLKASQILKKKYILLLSVFTHLFLILPYLAEDFKEMCQNIIRWAILVLVKVEMRTFSCLSNTL